MPKVIAGMTTSLDGFVADQRGSVTREDRRAGSRTENQPPIPVKSQSRQPGRTNPDS